MNIDEYGDTSRSERKPIILDAPLELYMYGAIPTSLIKELAEAR